MFFKKKIIVHDLNPEFRDELFNAQNKHRDDLEKQIQYMETLANPQWELLGKIILLQNEYSIKASGKNEKIQLSAMEVEYFLRGFLDMARHMQADLPEGVYKYINRRIESVLKELLNQIV